MADHRLYNLRSVPAAVASSDAMNMEGATRMFVHAIEGGVAWNGTANIQVSLDGTNWVNSATGQNLADDTYVEIAELARFIRVDVTAYVAGTALTILVGTREP